MLGHVIPLTLLAVVCQALIVAGAATLIGIYTYELAYVTAPQDIPNS